MNRTLLKLLVIAALFVAAQQVDYHDEVLASEVSVDH